MLNYLKQIYQKLPVIREFKALETTLAFKLSEQNRLTTALHQLQAEEYTQRLLQAPRYSDTKNLNRHEFKLFSQFGEDGMISEVFRRIGAGSRTFVEIGVGDGLENNTVQLLMQGWNGWWIEGDGSYVSQIKRTFSSALAKDRLKVRQSFVTAENIMTLLAEMSVPPEVDLLSLDVDQNTYYVWAAMTTFRPRVLVIEYNANFPSAVDWKVNYDSQKVWDGTLCYGASLKALQLLGESLGYALVGCPISGANAFFVRQDLCTGLFEEPYTSEHHYQPPRFFLYRKVGHPPRVEF